MIRGWTIAAAVGATALVGIPAVLAAIPRTRVEQPAYTVEKRHPRFEVRRYAARIVAEVEVSGTPRMATNRGFRILADYIFGNNSADAKVAMTAPVDRRRSERIEMTAPVDRTRGARAWIIAFTMPSTYTLATLPKPADHRISIRRVPPSRYAVMRFSGAPPEPTVERRMIELLADVRAADYETTDAAPIYARYDPPWTPPFLRRNEILIELDPRTRRA
jgi:hypothetical protein